MSLAIEVRGQATTANQSTLRVRQMDPKVYQRRANYAMFVVFLRLLTMKRRSAAAGRKNSLAYGKGLKNCKSFKFEWQDIDPGAPTTTAAGTIDSSTTSLAVATGTGQMFTINDLVYNRETAEVFRVTDRSTDTLTISRGWGSTADAITSGDTLVLISSAFPEGTDSPIARAYSPTEFYNYTQIFKRAVENSGTMEATEHYGDVNRLSFQKQLEWDQFLLERARAYFVGRRNTAVDSTSGNNIYTTGGLDQWITSNIYSKSSLTYSYLIEFADMLYAYGGEEKILVCNDALLELIQKVVMEQKIQQNVSPRTKEFGINIKRIETCFGPLDLMPDKTMKDLFGSVPTGYGLEPALLEEMVLRPDVWKENVQDNDTDGRKDLIIGESGIKVISEQRHAKIVIA